VPVHRIPAPILLLLLVTACAPQHQVAELSGTTMGTGYSIQVVDLPEEPGPHGLREKIEAELELVNDLMSTYRDDSELSRFNRSRSTDWFAVSPGLAALVQEAILTSEMSGGAFDATVGPLVNLWGFGPETGLDRVPSDAEIARARARVGYRKLSVRLQPPAVRKAEPDLYLDLSAIAKGYGVDRIAESLDEAGILNYLVEIGGELRGRGNNGRGQPWQIAVERPDPGAREAHRVIELRGGAMATSGDYRNFFERDGRHYSHTIDPRTGHPVTHGLASVTVLTLETARADALATAFLVLGPEAGFALAESLQVAALFILRSPDGYSELQTGAFRIYQEESVRQK